MKYVYVWQPGECHIENVHGYFTERSYHSFWLINYWSWNFSAYIFTQYYRRIPASTCKCVCVHVCSGGGGVCHKIHGTCTCHCCYKPVYEWVLASPLIDCMPGWDTAGRWCVGVSGGRLSQDKLCTHLVLHLFLPPYLLPLSLSFSSCRLEASSKPGSPTCLH